MYDKQGRTYAKLSELKVGSIVIVDSGFDCMKPWSERLVFGPPDGLIIPCSEHGHRLEPQIADDGDSLIVTYHKEGFVKKRSDVRNDMNDAFVAELMTLVVKLQHNKTTNAKIIHTLKQLLRHA